MENYTEYSKKLCMSELKVAHSHFLKPHYFEAGCGKVNSSLIYLKQGSAVLHTVKKEICVGKGSLIFIPEGIRYHAVWTGTPDVEFYTLEIISKRPDTLDSPNYAMTYLSSLSTPKTEEAFEEIYSLFSSGTRVDKLRALGRYYQLYADVVPYLEEEDVSQRNETLQIALAYIEKNLQKDFDMSELASCCCISESRLYHIFKGELGKTPVHYRNELRIENAAAALQETNASTEQIAELCGFHSGAYFRETFRRFTGLSPAEYRKMVKR